MQLKQIEADVVITLHNPATGQMELYPFWECSMSPAEVRDMAADLALTFVEQGGGGHAQIDIHDFRDEVALKRRESVAV